MKITRKLLVTFIVACSVNIAALEYDLELNIGTDSNPLELSRNFTPDADQYTELDIRFRQEIIDNLRATIKLNKQSFFDLDDADEQNTAVKLDYVINSRLTAVPIKYRFDIEYNTVDKKYISKNLGTIGETSLLIPIPDRYNADWLDYRARADLNLTNKLRLDLNVIGRSKSYDDLSNLGLSSFGLQAVAFEPELRYTSGEQNLFTGKLITGSRTFDNRNGRDLTGIFVAGSELTYNYQGLKLGWRLRTTESQQYRFSYAYEAREDNVSGYFDATDIVLAVSYRNRLTDKQELRLGLSYKDFSFDNTVNASQNETEEAIYTKDGYDLSASYAYKFLQADYGDWWVKASLGYEDYSSVISNYIYDKSLFSIGLMLEH